VSGLGGLTRRRNPPGFFRFVFPLCKADETGVAMLELYYYPSYVSHLPHILLHEIGVEHKLIFVDRYANAHKREAYLKLNPNGLIPRPQGR
jgi:hypothetical protein